MENNNRQSIVKFDPNRRQFVKELGAIVGTSALMASPLISLAAKQVESRKAGYTVGEIMDLFIKEVPGAPFPNTVDTLKAGNRDIMVTGIVTTMFATITVIRKAIDAGCNFIIAHEPTFYNHPDDTGWLSDSDVYHYKANLLKEHNMAVWRNHDYVHSLVPDGVRKGVLQQLGWLNFGDLNGNIFKLQPVPTLGELIGHLKKRLNIQMLRYIGDVSQPCGKVCLMPGAMGVKRHVSAIIKYKPDVLICGEMSEWETAEYVRDARAKGDQISLVVLGHIASEEPGSAFMLDWLKKHVPGIKAEHIPAQNSLSFA
jgi:putative NIF3 family GTP cyclohydrolase 1 type 2